MRSQKIRRVIGILLAMLPLANLAEGKGRWPGNLPLMNTVPAQETVAPHITYTELGTQVTADNRIVKPDNSFAPDTPQIVCVWRVADIPPGGTTLRSVWVAEDTGGVAPPNFRIAEKSYPLAGPAPMVGNVSLSKPNKGWPSGRYRLELYLGEKPARTVPFRVYTEAEDKAYQQITSLLQGAEDLEQKGDYRRAVPLMQQALAVAEKSFGEVHPDTATLVNNLALLYKKTGDYAQSEQLYRRAVSLAEKLDGTESPASALTLNNLAEFYHQKGDYTQAEQLLQRALPVSEKTLGREHLLTATIINNLALASQAKGDYKQAERLYQQALPVYEKAANSEHAADFATLLNNFAELYREQDDYARAEPLYRRSLAILEKAYPADHPSVALTLNNLALLYLAKGDYAQAEPLFRRSLAIYEKRLGAQHANAAALLHNLALLDQERGLNSEAESLYERALSTFEKSLGAEHPDVARTLISLAQISAKRGDVNRTTTLLTRANEIREQNLALILTAGSEQQKQLYLDTLFGETNLTLSFHLQAAPNDPSAARLALTAVLRRKGRALDAMSDQIGALRRRLNPSDQALLDQLASTRSRLATLSLGNSNDEAGADERQANIKSLEAEAQRLEREVSARSVEYRTETRPVTLERVQAAIPPDAALVELVRYYPYDFRAQRKSAFTAAHYAAYLLRQEGPPSWVDLGDAAPVDRDVNDLRVALSKPSSTNVMQAARALDERVMRPVRKLLGETRKLFLSPDGALNLVPFGALVDEDNHYLVENYTITYLTSGRDLLRFETHLRSLQEPTIIANPAFDRSGDEGGAAPEQRGMARRSVDLRSLVFNPLPGTAGEAKAISTFLPGAKVLTGAAATEAALKRVRSPSILHVATHGFFLPDQPLPTVTETRGLGLSMGSAPETTRIENPLLRSGLVLAGANQREGGEGEDGILTALEASGLDLWGTKLVVLSACETGVGEVKNGEGVYGLRRALVLAGSESQVMSLWQVSDEATRDLMVEFYQRLHKGEGRTEALRQVQMEMLKGAQQSRERQSRGLALSDKDTNKPLDRSHPFFWASFIQSGDWRPLAEKFPQ